MKTKTLVKKAPLQERHGPIIREHETWTVGDIAFQGDLIFVCIGALPKGATLRANRQLAEGDTKGSRHVLEGGECFDGNVDVVCSAVKEATKNRFSPTSLYIGPVFTGPATVRHPQHQDQAFPANTVTACVFQRNLDAEGREQRARD